MKGKRDKEKRKWIPDTQSSWAGSGMTRKGEKEKLKLLRSSFRLRYDYGETSRRSRRLKIKGEKEKIS